MGDKKAGVVYAVCNDAMSAGGSGTVDSAKNCAGAILWWGFDDAKKAVDVAVSIDAGPQFKILARNPLGEKAQASMAVAHGQLFIRTVSSLFCLDQGVSTK